VTGGLPRVVFHDASAAPSSGYAAYNVIQAPKSIHGVPGLKHGWGNSGEVREWMLDRISK